MEQHTVRVANKLPNKKIFLGKFPTKAPNLAPKQEHWSLEKSDQDGELTLQREEPNPIRYTGTTGGGIASSAPSNYFLLVRKAKTKEFHAIPIDDWATFKMESNRSNLQLEEAEAQMKYQRMQADRINPRLAKAIDGTQLTSQIPGGNDDEADSDEEWKDIKARAASRTAVAAPEQPDSKQGNAAITTDKFTAAKRNHHSTKNKLHGDDDDGDNTKYTADGIYVPKPRDAEDWEHESEAADDDLDMGAPSDEDEDDHEMHEMGTRHNPMSMSDSDGEMDAKKVQKTIKKMLQYTGLRKNGSLSDEDDEDEDDVSDEDDDEDDLDEDDLDKMANDLLEGNAGSISPKPGAEVVGSQRSGVAGVISGSKSMPGAVSKKRKTPPVTTTPSGTVVEAEGKKLKAAGPPSVLSITAEEVVSLLRDNGGKMLLSAVGKHFKSRVRSRAERVEFSKLLKTIVNMKGGENKETIVTLKQ